uniref:Uncharacterized protein n=1 Tax=Zeugodacus cucurbitae TaxID=28588 RepID=A0A0A1XQF3_ZEUCU
MWFEYLIFVLIGLTQIYFCNGAIERYRSTKDAETTDGMLRRNRRAAAPPFIANSHVHEFTDGGVFILERQTPQRNPTGKIISSQQLTQQRHGLPNNQYYQQQPQTFQRVHLNNAQKPRGNQQAHNSRQLQINGQSNSNNNVYHNDNGFIGNDMKNGNKLIQEPNGQIGITQMHKRNNGNYNHHNSYQAIEYNNENTRNSAILGTNVEMGAKLTNAALFTRPAVRMEAIHQPLGSQNINSNNNLLTKITAQPTLTEYNRSQFRRNIPDNPFLNKEMLQNPFMQNPFLTNRQTTAYTTQNTPPATVQHPYTLNPFLQNTKIPNLSNQSQPTKFPTTGLIQPQIATTAKPFVQIISTTPQSTTTTSKVTTINAELSQLIRNKAVIFPDSIYLTRTTPSIEHLLDIRR